MIEHLGRWLVVIGVAVALGGGLLILMGRLVPSGRLLPGDIVVRRPGFTLYFPLVTCVVLSLALTAVGTVAGRALAQIVERGRGKAR